MKIQILNFIKISLLNILLNITNIPYGFNHTFSIVFAASIRQFHQQMSLVKLILIIIN